MLAQRGALPVAVTFESPEQARRYIEESGWPWPLLVDRDRAAYSAFGMVRGSYWNVLGLHLWPGYIRTLFRAGRPKLRRPNDDVYQLGGNALIDAEGVVRQLHRSGTPLDRPSIDELLEWIDATDGSAPETTS